MDHEEFGWCSRVESQNWREEKASPFRPSPREAGAGGTSSGVSYKWDQDKGERGGKEAGPQFVCTALTGPACGGQAEKLLVRHTNTTPLHLRCDRKSAEALESKGVVERPLRKRVRKMKKGKGIDEKRASW